MKNRTLSFIIVINKLYVMNVLKVNFCLGKNKAIYMKKKHNFLLNFKFLMYLYATPNFY